MAIQSVSSMSQQRQSEKRPARKARVPGGKENAIRWIEEPQRRGGREVRERAPEGKPKRAGAAKALSDQPVPQKVSTTAMPDFVRAHFVQVGRNYHFSDGARGFTDKKTKLTTPSENTQLIRDLVAIAQARGWQSVAVSGTERFRKEAWIAAREAGLAVRGYRASKFDETRLVRHMATSERSQSYEEGKMKSSRTRGVREPDPKPQQRQHVGMLMDHGPAPYQHEPGKPMSYFVRLDTGRGERDFWGVDLERAFRESLSRPHVGDEVVLRAVRREPVTVKGVAGAPGDQPKDLATHRNRWMVEKKEFLARREEAAQVLRDPKIPAKQGSQSHPELLGSYLQMHAAELAAKRFPDAKDRERFVNTVRGAMADSVARGEPLPAVRMRTGEAERALKEFESPSKERKPGRGREHE